MAGSPSKNLKVEEPPLKKGKLDSSVSETDPAFDIATGANSSSNVGENSQSTFDSSSAVPFDSIVPKTEEDLTLPKNLAPATNLKKNTVTTNSGLALPKKNDNKAKATESSKSGVVSKNTGANKNSQTQTDASKMSDVLFSAGVDLKEEEALLNSSVNASKSSAPTAKIQIPNHPPFLHPDQVSKFMGKVAKEQAFSQNFSRTPEMLDMISTACETYMKDIITNAIVISRHRRKALKANYGRRSDVSKILRSIALEQKKEEERRVKKRIALGLEKEDLENKIDSEETLHRASNATAGLRAGSKKQYGWLTSSTSKPITAGSKTAGKVASANAARGESGLKFREAREEPGLVMRDLLFALENRRIGSSNVISKGYARIRD